MSRFVTAELYPQLVYLRELGGKALTKAQLDLVSNAAIRACDVAGVCVLPSHLEPNRSGGKDRVHIT